MVTLAAADRVDILVLVDNATDFLSSSPADVEGELSRFWRRSARYLAGDLICCAAHGFSCAIAASVGATTRTLLFDAGPEGAVLTRNVERLGYGMGGVDALFLSHGHWDHAGGMLDALAAIRRGNGGREVTTFMHPGMYRPRAMRAPDGTMRPFADVPDAATLERHGARVVHATAPQTVLDDLFLVSGEIARTTPFEKGLPGQHALADDGTWQPDPLVIDERFVAVRVKDKGTFVFSACSHAGVVNVMRYAKALLPDEPLHGVMGGFHLAGTTEGLIPETVAALGDFGLKLIAPAHCTGWRAVGALAGRFGAAVVPSAVGKTYRL
jgi:7,8-dihydropterin-6-yl-methyl-4-(beta-D-ribofuranosyl)aminobenzene 5'-phosphate synthase